MKVPIAISLLVVLFTIVLGLRHGLASLEELWGVGEENNYSLYVYAGLLLLVILLFVSECAQV